MNEVPNPAVPAAPVAAPADAPAKPVVLYVEDNPINLRLMRQICARRPGLALREAVTAELGIELARAQTPALILLDVNLPGMSGYQALEILKADPLTAAIPVVAVSANAMLGDCDRGLAAGFQAYVTKPIHVPQFLALMDGLLGGVPCRAVRPAGA